MITLKDLAQKLDVSVSTVSKALNNSSEISTTTINRVKETAKLLNYRPNQLALSLKNNKTNTIGVIIPDIQNHFFARVLLGIEKEATNKGYNIITCITNETLSKEQQSLELLSNGSVDGFILSVSEETQLTKNINHFKQASTMKIPMVMFDRITKEIDCDKIMIDDFDAAFEATNFLISKGRHKIALISSIDNLNVGKSRVNGYNEALKNALNYKSTGLILTLTKDDEPHERIEQFLKDNADIDAVFAIDNTSGTMAINIASAIGKQIPKDIAVIGFANSDIANFSVPKLTTVNQHAEDIGKRSLNLLVNRLEKDSNNTYETVLVPISIDERQST